MNETDDVRCVPAGAIATIVIHRPPHNFFDVELISRIATVLEELDRNPECRAVVLASEGKSFCAGAKLGADSEDGTAGAAAATTSGRKHLYKEAIRLFRTQKPIIAAIHGAAIGGGLGLACAADFRVTCSEAQFSANFTRLGFHPGFGLTATLPRLVGPQAAALLLYTGRRLPGDEAHRIGLSDLLVPQVEVRSASEDMARQIADSAPLAVQSTRATLRRGFADLVEVAAEREHFEQGMLMRTRDFKEGVRAATERREPHFKGA